jgi:UDP-N-acetylglucosamine acyltransferase
MNHIHPTAVVDPTARIGANVKIGPCSVIGANAVIGDDTVVGPSCIVGPNTTMGRRNVLHGHCAVGGDPQDKSYRGEEVRLVLGDDNHVREFVTINRGTSKGDGITRVGNRNLFMACSHVAHDCVVGDGVILANNVLLAGHVSVDDGATLSGAVAVQQFVTIGKMAYVGGHASVKKDFPPFMKEDDPSQPRGVINFIGMQRAGYSDEQIKALDEAFRTVYVRSDTLAEGILRVTSAPMTAEVQLFIGALQRSHAARDGRAREPR